MPRSSLQRAVEWRRRERTLPALAQLPKASGGALLPPSAPAGLPRSPGAGALAHVRRFSFRTVSLARLAPVARPRPAGIPRARRHRVARASRSARLAAAAADDGDGPGTFRAPGLAFPEVA